MVLCARSSTAAVLSFLCLTKRVQIVNRAIDHDETVKEIQAKSALKREEHTKLAQEQKRQQDQERAERDRTRAEQRERDSEIDRKLGENWAHDGFEKQQEEELREARAKAKALMYSNSNRGARGRGRGRGRGSDRDSHGGDRGRGRGGSRGRGARSFGARVFEEDRVKERGLDGDKEKKPLKQQEFFSPKKRSALTMETDPLPDKDQDKDHLAPNHDIAKEKAIGQEPLAEKEKEKEKADASLTTISDSRHIVTETKGELEHGQDKGKSELVKKSEKKPDWRDKKRLDEEKRREAKRQEMQALNAQKKHQHEPQPHTALANQPTEEFSHSRALPAKSPGILSHAVSTSNSGSIVFTKSNDKSDAELVNLFEDCYKVRHIDKRHAAPTPTL